MKTKVSIFLIGMAFSLSSCGVWDLGCPPYYELPPYGTPPPPPPRYYHHRPSPPPPKPKPQHSKQAPQRHYNHPDRR